MRKVYTVMNRRWSEYKILFVIMVAFTLTVGGCTNQSSVSGIETAVETSKESDSDTGTAIDSNTAVDNTGTKVDSNLNVEGDTDMNNDNQLNKNVPLSGPYGTLTFIGRASVRIDLDSGMVVAMLLIMAD
jgi:hypothetical protein